MFWNAFNTSSTLCKDYLNSIKGREASIRNIDEALQKLTSFIREFEDLRTEIGASGCCDSSSGYDQGSDRFGGIDVW